MNGHIGKLPDGLLEKLTTSPASELAVGIADDACRSDIELYAREVKVGVRRGYNLNETAEDRDDHIEIVSRAATYIEARGDVFPWRMIRDPDAPHLIFFIEKVTK